jgi:hypothetical protein
MTKLLADSFKIFEPVDNRPFIKKIIDACDNSCLPKIYLGFDYSTFEPKYAECSKDSDYTYCKFKKYVSLSQAMLFVRLLMPFKNDAVLSYNDVFPIVFDTSRYSLGHDKDSFLSLLSKKLICFDHKGKYKRPYYKITPLGKKVCEIAEINSIAYKVLRHVMKLDSKNENAVCATMIKIDTNPEYFSDLLPETFVSLLDELFNEKSKMHEIGSYAYWCSKLVKCLKDNKFFFDMFVCDEVNAYLRENESNHAVSNFKHLLEKLRKNHEKAV